MNNMDFLKILTFYVIMIINFRQSCTQFQGRPPPNFGFFPQQNLQQGFRNQRFRNQINPTQQGNRNPAFNQFQNSRPGSNFNNQQSGLGGNVPPNNNLPQQQQQRPPQLQQQQSPQTQQDPQSQAQQQPQQGGGTQIVNPRPALTEQIRNCVRSCPTTNEYNPVCGSDQISYGNMQKLQCASQCGQGVTFIRQGRCARLDRIQN